MFFGTHCFSEFPFSTSRYRQGFGGSFTLDNYFNGSLTLKKYFDAVYGCGSRIFDSSFTTKRCAAATFTTNKIFSGITLIQSTDGDFNYDFSSDFERWIGKLDANFSNSPIFSGELYGMGEAPVGDQVDYTGVLGLGVLGSTFVLGSYHKIGTGSLSGNISNKNLFSGIFSCAGQLALGDQVDYTGVLGLGVVGSTFSLSEYYKLGSGNMTGSISNAPVFSASLS